MRPNNATTILMAGAMTVFLAVADLWSGPAYGQQMIKDPFQPRYPRREPRVETTTTKSLTPARSKEVITPPVLSVQGLVWGEASPRAIIDNQVVKIGDTVKEAKIIGIDKDGVRILYRGDIFLIKPAAGGDLRDRSS